MRNASALPALQEEFQRVQSENYHMRDYIMQLQSRLLDVTGEFPAPPPSLELRDPRSGEPLRAGPQQQQDEHVAGQGAPPPPPQGANGSAPTASMAAPAEMHGGEYPSAGADGKVSSAESPYAAYEASKIERPSRPSPEQAGSAPAA